IDPRITGALIARPIAPPPHLVVLLRKHRVVFDEAHHQLLEADPRLGIGPRFAQRLDHLVHRRRHRPPPPSPVAPQRSLNGLYRPTPSHADRLRMSSRATRPWAGEKRRASKPCFRPCRMRPYGPNDHLSVSLGVSAD